MRHHVCQAEITALEQKRRPHDRCDGIGHAVAEIEPCCPTDEAELAALMRAAQPDDLVQDVLLSLHQVRHTYDPAWPFLPWLKAIACNRLADIQRRQARRAKREVAVAVLPETFSDVEAKEPVDRLADAEQLGRALAGLPRRQRQVVEMLRLKEMSLKEAAASGMSIPALKVSMHRAMKALRAVLTR